jgi:two-component system, LytTR family, sensor kinase
MMFLTNSLNRETLRKYVLLSLIALVLGVLFFIYVSFSELGKIPSPKDEFGKYLMSVSITLIGCLLVFNIDRLLDRFIHWRAHFLLRFLTGFIINATVATLVMTASGIFLLEADTEEILKLSVLLVICLFIYEIFYGWFFSYRFYAHTQVEHLRSERWQMELQFESLKNQISPHYLFNCLNTISSLLYKDSHMAEEFIRRMADTFRYVLTNQKQKLVTVRQEIEFVKSYYYLLQVRYEHHLKLEINLPKNILDTPMPPLTLQLLVENAVKHNQISKDLPLLVYISAQDNTHINVTNTKTQPINPLTSFKIGLENIRHRYSFFSKEKVVVKNEEKFTVKLPVIKNLTNNKAAAQIV